MRKPESAFPFLDQRGKFQLKDSVTLRSSLPSFFNPSFPNGIKKVEKENFINTRRQVYQAAKEWTRSLTHEEKTVYRVMRRQVFTFLGVNSFDEIQALIPKKNDDPQTIADKKEKRKAVSETGYELFGKMFGLTGKEEQIKSEIKGYADIADGVIHSLRTGPLKPIGGYIEMTNEVEATNNPTDLLFMAFDNRYAKKARFEAIRKVYLMLLAASTRKREKETNIEENYNKSLELFNQFIWSNEKVGDTKVAVLKSTHSLQDLSCLAVETLDQEKAKNTKLKQVTEKLTPVHRRKFTFKGKDYPAYVTGRQKPGAGMVYKSFRKGAEDPAIAVDDHMGLIVVLENEGAIKRFEDHLLQKARESGSMGIMEENEDKLKVGYESSTNENSSIKVRFRKCFIRMHDMRLELILHTNQTYIDSLYRDEASHKEYELRRLFKDNVVELLFPRSIYEEDGIFENLENELIAATRQERRKTRGDFPFSKAA